MKEKKNLGEGPPLQFIYWIMEIVGWAYDFLFSDFFSTILKLYVLFFFSKFWII